jgi:flagellar basal-body rod protein FlgB
MKTGGLFGGSFVSLEKALDLRSRIHNAVSSNIANMNSADYRPVRIDFAEEMDLALSAEGGGKLAATDDRHINRPLAPYSGHLGWMEDPLYEFKSKKYLDEIDMDQEMSRLAKNNLMYNASSTLIARKFRGLLSAIQSGGK